MKNTDILIILSTLLCYLTDGFAVQITQNVTSKNDEKRERYTSVQYLTQNERNRRLIPYATYYVAGNHEQSNSLQNTSPTDVENPANEDERHTSLKSVQQPIKYTVKSQDGYNKNSRFDLANGYSYIPIAYIQGTGDLNYNTATNYNPSYYTQNSDLSQPSNLYTTAKPTYTTGIPSSIPKHKSIQQYNEFFSSQNEVPANGLVRYLVTTVGNGETITSNNGVKKINSYRVQNAQPILYGTSSNDYLNFHYSDLYKGQMSEYDTSTTPLTVEITSPKHYIVPESGNAATSSNHQIRVTTSSTPSVNVYRGPAQFAHSASLSSHSTISTNPPSPVTAEQATQSSKLLLTITKDQEIENQSLNSNYQSPYVQKPYVQSVTTPEFTIDDVFKGYNINKQLPERITADNIKESIRTLSYILQVLQKADSITHFEKKPSLYTTQVLDGFKETTPLFLPELPKSANTFQNYDPLYQTYDIKQHIAPQLLQNKPSTNEHNTPGRSGIDYPTYAVIPETRFSCKTQRYKGFFADPETKCQVWHYCDLNGGQASFLCPNGTIFSQAALTCDWWFNVKCAATTQLYVLNERLYKYILPVRPSFPEDYSGPLVDQYLTEKFKETESKRKYRYPTNTTTKAESNTSLNLTAFDEYDIPAHLLNENL